MSPVSEMLQAHYIQVSDNDPGWKGKGHGILECNKPQIFSTNLLSSALLQNELKSQTVIAFCTAHRGEVSPLQQVTTSFEISDLSN